MATSVTTPVRGDLRPGSLAHARATSSSGSALAAAAMSSEPHQGVVLLRASPRSEAFFDASR